MGFSGYLEAMRFGPRAFWGSMPQYFVFFVTHRCVASCDHCFDWVRRDDPSYSDELSLDEIEKVSRTMDDVMFMFLTGGEPFIREDLSEIAKIFQRNNGVRKFQSPTNGWYTDRVVARLVEFAESCPDTHFGIGVSIDAIGDEHDESRNCKGLFERAIRTIKEVQRLAKQYPNIGINAVTCISKNNEKTIAETYRYLLREVGVKTMFFTIVRGEPRSGACKGTDFDLYRSFSSLTEEDMLRDPSHMIGGFPFARLINWRNVRKQEVITEIIRNDRYVTPCVAGRTYGILYANGDLYPCEMLDHCLGNLREYGYDFNRIWLASENRLWVREKIQEKRCYCTHENALAASLLFNPKELLGIVCRGLSAELKRRFFEGPPCTHRQFDVPADTDTRGDGSLS